MRLSFVFASAAFACAALFSALPSRAADDKEKVVPDKGAGELDLTQFPGQVVEEVIVPVPRDRKSVV